MTKVEVIKADITELDCEAIVNAANNSLLGGGGVDGVIHYKAGPDLLKECELLGGCPTGEAKITKGYGLRAQYIIHAVGPIWQNGSKQEAELLMNTYRNSIQLANKHGIKSIAFPNISTGVFRFPKQQAARIALKTVQEESWRNGLKRVIFACYDQENFEIYSRLVGETNNTEKLSIEY